MGLANVSVASTVFSRSLRLLWKSGRILKNLEKNCRFRVKNLGNFPKIAAFPRPETFLGNRPKVEIYTDSCAMSPFESGSLNLDSGIGIGVVLVINGDNAEFFSL